MSKQEIFDALIIGGGPAGISCAAELKDSGLSSVILERKGQLGGQLSDVPNPLRNFAGGNYANGDELRQKLTELVEAMKLNYVLNADVTDIDLQNKTVVVAGQKYFGKTIVIATGYRVNVLGVDNEKQFEQDVVYRTGHCLDHMAEQTVAVVGGGDSAVDNALELAQLCPRVYIIYRGEKLRARPDWLEKARQDSRITILLNTKVVALVGDGNNGSLKALKILNERGVESELSASRLVVKIGYAANTELFRGKVDMDTFGNILIGNFCATSVPGVFAAGDITSPGYPRIATSVGQGVLAVAGIRMYLGQCL